MQITNINNSGKLQYDPFLLEALEIGSETKAKKSENSNNTESVPSGWQKDILLSALDKLEDNIQVDNSSPLNYSASAPIETYSEALAELRGLVENDFEKYASAAQANLTPADILYLFEEEADFVV